MPDRHQCDYLPFTTKWRRGSGSCADGIPGRDHYDRDRARDLARRYAGIYCNRDDYVDVEPDQFAVAFRQPRQVAFRSAVQDYNVLVLDITERTQPLKKLRIARGIRLRRAGPEKPTR